MITDTGEIVTVNFKDYVKNVLPNEWRASWDMEALRTGAMAAKIYAWYLIRFPKYPGRGYDLRDDTNDQVYEAGSSHPRTDQAVEETWEWVMTRNGEIVLAQYDSGYPGSPDPIYAGRLSQWGSQYWAERGMDWQWILDYYYGPIDLFRLEDIGGGELLIARPQSGRLFWYGYDFINGSHTHQAEEVGAIRDIVVAGDYDGDGQTDLAVFRPSEAWYIQRSTDGWFKSMLWGEPGDIPVPADYDGDGKFDLAVWRPSDGKWYIRLSSTWLTQTIIKEWGIAALGDVPAPADYDGDGRADIAIWRPSDSEMVSWWVIKSSDGRMMQSPGRWGEHGDIPVPGDYDGDGRADFAVWRPSDRDEVSWWVVSSATYSQINFSGRWGEAGDIPVPKDYDGDGITDRAVWRPSDGNWYLRLSSQGGAIKTVQWGHGAYGDRPVFIPSGYSHFAPSGPAAIRAEVNGKLVTAEYAGTAPLIANRSVAGSWERFEFVNLGNGKVAVKALVNGKFVCAENGGAQPLQANRTAALSWETFEYVPLGGNRFALMSMANGKFVCADNGGADPLIANRDLALSWETFSWEPLE